MKSLIILSIFLAATTSLPSTKIIGGEDAERGELPYQIRIYQFGMYKNSTRCGGTLVTLKGKQFMLTSASCVRTYRNNPEMFMLFAGELKISAVEPFEQYSVANRIILHPEFDHGTKVNNLAIVTYDPVFNFTDDVKPIELPPQGWEAEGQVRISGWGYSDREERDADHLQKRELSLISKDYCRQLHENHFFHPDEKMLCAWTEDKVNAHCFEDLGGPAVSVDEGFLAGIMIYPDWCNREGNSYPDVYTDVASFVDWISEKVDDL